MARVPSTTHKLKTWPAQFEAIRNGSKTFEFRKTDREYRVGDRLVLQEWEPESQCYTGRDLEVRVTYITVDPAFGIPVGYCVMSIAGFELPQSIAEPNDVRDLTIATLAEVVLDLSKKLKKPE